MLACCLFVKALWHLDSDCQYEGRWWAAWVGWVASRPPPSGLTDGHGQFLSNEGGCCSPIYSPQWSEEQSNIQYLHEGSADPYYSHRGSLVLVRSRRSGPLTRDTIHREPERPPADRRHGTIVVLSADFNRPICSVGAEDILEYIRYVMLSLSRETRV